MTWSKNPRRDITKKHKKRLGLRWVYDVMKEKLDMLGLDLITKELGLVVYGRKVGLQRKLNDLW